MTMHVWLFNNSDILLCVFRGKSSRLRVRKVGAADTGTYSCEATNIIGTKQAQILVTVNSQVTESTSK